MAQYFYPRRAPSLSVTSYSYNDNHVPSSRGDWCDGDTDNQMASSSILIFPTPSSEPESTRSASESRFDFSESTPSLPTDGSLESVRSSSRPRGQRGEAETENERVWRNMSRALPRDRWREFQLEEELAWELNGDYLDTDGTRHTSHSRPEGRSRTSSSTASSFSRTLTLAPQPPFRLPFISFLQNFLTLDESTLHLISRSTDPNTSVLFPVSPGRHTPSEGEEDIAHGILKLLFHNPDKPKNTQLLKAGIDPSEVPVDANPLLGSPTRVPVWQLLKFLMKGGARAWNEVKSWEASEMRLIGV